MVQEMAITSLIPAFEGLNTDLTPTGKDKQLGRIQTVPRFSGQFDTWDLWKLILVTSIYFFLYILLKKKYSRRLEICLQMSSKMSQNAPYILSKMFWGACPQTSLACAGYAHLIVLIIVIPHFFPLAVLISGINLGDSSHQTACFMMNGHIECIFIFKQHWKNTQDMVSLWSKFHSICTTLGTH